MSRVLEARVGRDVDTHEMDVILRLDRVDPSPLTSLPWRGEPFPDSSDAYAPVEPDLCVDEPQCAELEPMTKPRTGLTRPCRPVNPGDPSARLRRMRASPAQDDNHFVVSLLPAHGGAGPPDVAAPRPPGRHRTRMSVWDCPLIARSRRPLPLLRQTMGLPGMDRPGGG
jgi:hypothetical protein